MSREQDLHWYLSNRKTLAEKYQGQWLVVLGLTIMRAFPSEKEAVEFSVKRYGINQASVFQATEKDPTTFV